LEREVSGRVREVSAVRGLLDREELLRLLDRAVTKRVTVISAPPGSGKTSLLRAWAERSAEGRRVAFVSVEREQQNAERFWSAVLDAIRGSTGGVDHETHTDTTTALDGDALVEAVRLEVAEQARPVVLIIDDLHELGSADALGQLEDLVGSLPSSARLVLSSRRDPPIRLHRLRLADDLAEIRAGDLRFTEGETRELLATSGISLSDSGAAALRKRTRVGQPVCGWLSSRSVVTPILSVSWPSSQGPTGRSGNT
jgi:LuxR family transcriptional regulator, maltose regulon positive regulatory protein